MSSLISFSALRTKRLTLQLGELTIGQSIELAGMNPKNNEAIATSFLRMAMKSVTGEQDPLNWTVQERMFAVAHYLSSALDDGPNFSLGDAKYADYLDGATDNSDKNNLPIGEVEGDSWHIRHLTGAMVESIERLQGLVERTPGKGLEGRSHWMTGVMAAQMYVSGDEYCPEVSDGEAAMDEWLARRMQILINFPAGGFGSLLYAFHAGRDQLNHLFNVGYDGDGLLTLPASKEGVANLPPCRFPVRSCIQRFVLDMV